MKEIEIDITNKTVPIECPNCNKTFIESTDDLKVKGSVKCPHCEYETLITVKNK